MKTALNLEKNAAYLHNEAGIIFQFLGNADSAGYHFKKATQISPNWFIPWRHLSTAYFYNGQIDSSRQAVKIAAELNHTFPGIINQQGRLAEYDHNHLKAEQYYYTSIKKNGHHYYPFERLGFVQIQYLNFALADSNFYEAERRKAGFNALEIYVDNPALPFADEQKKNPTIPECLLPDSVHHDDPIILFLKGYEAECNKNYSKAIDYYQRCLVYHPDHPLALHYLGRIYLMQKQYKEAAFVIKIAQRNHLPNDSLISYFQKHIRKIRNTDTICAFNQFKFLNYPLEYDYYILGYCQEKLNSYHRASNVYAELLNRNHSDKIGFYKLRNCYEKNNQWKDAYELFNLYPDIQKKSLIEAERCAFFRRMDTMRQLNPSWAYEAARFHDQLVRNSLTWPVFSLEKPYAEPLENDLWTWTLFEKKITVPITEEDIDLAGLPGNKIFRALYFLRKAANTTLNRQEESDCYQRIASLFEKMAVPDSAMLYYRKALMIDTAENIRDQLMVILNQDRWPYYKMLQMDSLYQQNKLEYEHYLHYADLKSKAHLHDEANNLMAAYLKVNPGPSDTINHLQIRINLAKSEQQIGIERMKEWLKKYPKDFQMMYALSRVLYEQQKQHESMTWLQKAIESGFPYYWVLHYDTVWQKLHNTPEWKALTAKIPKPEITEYIPTR